MHLASQGRRVVVVMRVLLVMLACVAALAGCRKKNKGPAFESDHIAVGASRACATMRDKSIACWGGGAASRTPLAADVVDVVVGDGNRTCVRTADAHVRCDPPMPELDSATLSDVAELALAPRGGCVRHTSGAVACFGLHGALGVEGVADARAIAVGEDVACALRGDGAVLAWNPNPPPDGALTAKRVVLPPAIGVAAGGATACAVLGDRTASCWGKNDHGQLGDGTKSDRATPAAVDHLASVRAIALGQSHACARLYDGTLRCWGANALGQLTDGTRDDRTHPVMISGLFDVQEAHAGVDFTCALSGDRYVKCWGANDVGQGGDGSTAPDRPVPVAVKFRSP